MGAFVVLDTETTGLPTGRGNVDADNCHKWDSCRMVQLAWEIYQSPDDSDPVSYQCHLVQPNGFTIPDQATRIHGITTEYAQQHGLPVAQIMEMFFQDIQKHGVQTAVAHNIKFDENVIVSEMLRTDMDQTAWSGLRKHCTMLAATKKGERWPKLSALYTTLVGPIHDSTSLHRADVDARLCADIYKVQQKKSHPI